MKTQVVDRLIVLEQEYYSVTCVGTSIDQERTPTMLMLDPWRKLAERVKNIQILAMNNKEQLFFSFARHK